MFPRTVLLGVIAGTGAAVLGILAVAQLRGCPTVDAPAGQQAACASSHDGGSGSGAHGGGGSRSGHSVAFGGFGHAGSMHGAGS